jgi:hypothetical protein
VRKVRDCLGLLSCHDVDVVVEARVHDGRRVALEAGSREGHPLPTVLSFGSFEYRPAESEVGKLR